MNKLKLKGQAYTNRLITIMIVLTVINVASNIFNSGMYYRVNYSGNNNNITQNVNINTGEDEKLDINNCSLEALKTLPGIGEGKAKDIIAARPFASPQDIRKVVGEKIYYNVIDKIK